MDDEHWSAAGRPRWAGQPGRLEVWYLTATDERTGAGLWVHHEIVSPVPRGTAHAHGWASWFPKSEDGAPRSERFGPEGITPAELGTGGWWHEGARAAIGPRRLRGEAGTLRWDLQVDPGSSPPLYTFPRLVWRRELLPAAQVVPLPAARATGTVTVDGQEQPFEGPAGLAHIWGHGNAQRWCWLHADLGGGDVLEIVAATARRPALRRLPPLPVVQLRVAGHDWPRNPLLAAPALRASIDGTSSFSVRGTLGRQRLRVDVALPPERAVVLEYTDPDGAKARCTNTEQATADIRIERWARGWQVQREWHLARTAHAEIGDRRSNA